jgi:uncharacterized protein YbcI
MLIHKEALMSNKISKGQIEAKIREFIIKFEKEHMGRGPEETTVDILGDIIFVRLKGVLTVAEKTLAKDPEGKILVKQTRVRLLESSRKILEKDVEELTGAKVITMHTDISTKTGERIIVFTLPFYAFKRC